MKTFNAIQMIILLMASPSLLSLCYNATFPGARAVFYVCAIGTIALAIWNIVLVRMGIEDDK